MKSDTASVILALLFLLVAGLRIATAFSTQQLNYDGYQTLRFVEHIKEHGTPLINDNLSFNGREFIYSPLFYYLMTFFTLLGNTIIILKFIPNIIISASVLIVYFITYDITKKRVVSLLATLFAGFTPIFFSQYINDASPWTLTIPLFLWVIYGLLDIKKRYLLTIITSTILGLLNPILLVIPLGTILYMLICKLENINITNEYKEITLFILLFGMWSTLIIFKKVFSIYGMSAVWQGLPSEIIKVVFRDSSLKNATYTIGILSMGFGGFAAYHSIFYKHLKKNILISSIAGMIGLVLLFKIIPLNLGFILLSLLSSILAGRGLQLFISYMNKTKVPWIKQPIIIIGILFFIFSSIIPGIAFAQESIKTPSQELLNGINWLKTRPNIIPANAVVLAPPQEGFLIEEIAKEPTVIDNNFLSIKNIDIIYEDVKSIYQSRFATAALRKLSNYNIKFIIFDNNAKKNYDREDLLYKNNNCFQKVFNEKDVTIYEVLCDVRTI